MSGTVRSKESNGSEEETTKRRPGLNPKFKVQRRVASEKESHVSESGKKRAISVTVSVTYDRVTKFVLSHSLLHLSVLVLWVSWNPLICARAPTAH